MSSVSLPTVAIVILNYNTRQLLEKFLPSVLATSYASKKIWIIDNHSTDDSVEFLQKHYDKEINLLVTPSNLGYAGGYNWALNQIDADYYVLLNSDVDVKKDWLDPLVNMAESNAQIGALQPKILDQKSPSKFEYAGASGGYLDKWGYAFCRGRIFDSLEEDNGQYDDTTKIFWATGACLFIKSHVYHSSGGLDSDFFAHMEEIDLCWRIQRMGYTIYVNPESCVYHVGGGTLTEGSEMKYLLNYRNNLFLLTKNLQTPFWFLIVLWRMVLDGVSGLKFVLDGKSNLLLIIIKAHLQFWKSMVKTLRKRRQVKKLGDSKVELYIHSVVWQYFAKKKKKFTDLIGTV